MPQSSFPFTTRLAEFVGRLAGHLTIPGSESDLPPSWRIALLAHLHAIGVLLRGSPESLGDSGPPAEPRFVPTSMPYRMVFPAPRNPPPPPREFALLLRAQRWRTILAQVSLPGRVEFDALLRDPEGKAVLAADRRLARALRPLAWMFGIEAPLVPRARPRPTVILVPGADAGVAREEYVKARKTLSQVEVVERYCTPPIAPRPASRQRPVWLGPDPCRTAIVSRVAPPPAPAPELKAFDPEMQTDAPL